jgi:transcriptional regulator with XRE-family HTH domain
MALPVKKGIIRQLRDERGWTQEELAKRAGINKQSIHRIEAGHQKRGTHPQTVERLAKALGVEPSMLTGRPPRLSDSDGESISLSGSTSQINIRVDNAVRNALSLTAQRYNVQLSEIIELAPFLFFLVAEESLQSRRKNLEKVSEAIGEAEDLRKALRYLSIEIHGNDRVILEEERSIKERDIFARLLKHNYNHYDDNIDNPFTAFLQRELKTLQKEAKQEEADVPKGRFYGWHPDVWSTPGYAICQDEASNLVGDDKEATVAILLGHVALHEIPSEIRNASPEALAQWIKRRVKETEEDLLVSLE